jgi:hypothetical protein
LVWSQDTRLSYKFEQKHTERSMKFVAEVYCRTVRFENCLVRWEATARPLQLMYKKKKALAIIENLTNVTFYFVQYEWLGDVRVYHVHTVHVHHTGAAPCASGPSVEGLYLL